MTINIKENLKEILKFNKLIPRLIVSWFILALYYIFKYEIFTELSFAQDTSLVLTVVLIGVFFIILSISAFFTPKINIDSMILFIVSSTLIFTVFSRGYYGTGDILKILGFILIYIFILLFTYRENKELIELIKPNKLTTIVICAIVGLISTLILSFAMAYKVKTLSSPNFDYGLFNNVFHNLKTKGLPYATSERDQLLSHFKVHISPVFYLILPIYMIFPYAETLNVVQAIFTGLGLIPIILIMFYKKRSNMEIILMSIIYSFNAVIWTSGFYDFHENAFLLLPLLFLFYFSMKKNRILMGVMSIIVLMVKEDAAFYLFVFGIYLILKERRYIDGSVMSVVSLIYFFICITILKQHGTGAMTDRFQSLIYNDGGIVSMFKTILDNPSYAIKDLFTSDKLIYVIEVMTPLLFIPFMIKKPANLLLLVPLLLNLLSSWEYLTNINFQYHYGVMAFLFLLMIDNMEHLNEKTTPYLYFTSTFVTISLYIALVMPNARYFSSLYKEYKGYFTEKIEMLREIPKEYSVSSNGFYISYIYDREVVYETYYHGRKDDVDCVVLDENSQTDMNLYNYYISKGYTVYREDYGVKILIKP